MRSNPFSSAVGGAWEGKRIIAYNYAMDSYHLEDGTQVDANEVHTSRYQMSGLREVKKPDKLKVTKDYLISRRAARWNKRMVRIANRKWDQRKLVAAEVGWKVGSAWALTLALILSIYGLKMVLHVVLG